MHIRTRISRLSVVVALVVAGLALAAAPVQGQTLDAPQISKSFGAASILLGSTTTLSFTITNPNASNALSGVAFNDPLPVGLEVASPNGLSSTCGGTTTATALSTSVSLSGGALAANASCTIQVNVLGVSLGIQDNLTSDVTSTDTDSGNSAAASVTVVAALTPPSISKSFGTASILLDSTTTLGFTITNPNSSSLSGVGFSDPLPAGLVVATPNGLTGSCDGGVITATAGTTSVSLSGATLSGGTSCIFQVNVLGIALGTWTNTTSAVTSNEGGSGNAATASVTVVAVLPSNAVRFVVTAPACVTPGAAFTVSVSALNADGTVDTLYAGIVHLSSSDPLASFSADASLTNGQGAFSVIVGSSGAQSITATDTVTAISGSTTVVNCQTVVPIPPPAPSAPIPVAAQARFTG